MSDENHREPNGKQDGQCNGNWVQMGLLGLQCTNWRNRDWWPLISLKCMQRPDPFNSLRPNIRVP